MPQQLFTYWMIAQVIGLAGMPLARLALGALPDAGYPFAKALGLLVAGYLAWLLAMLGLAPFGVGLVAGCIVLMAVLGALAHADGRPRAVWAWLRANWRMVLAYELIFTAAFIYLAIQRSYEWGFVGPNPWGTERPMDFAFFNAIQRSASFPPHDPWMSGFSINYYYLGYLLMAAVALLGGLPAGVSYNLSLALLFGLTAQGVAGLVVALARLARPRLPIAGKSGWAAALLSVVLVLGVSNQVGVLQVISGTGLIHVVALPDMARLISNGLGPRETVTLREPFNDITEITPTDRVKDFDWWVESRALWDTFPNTDGAPPNKGEVITEFPFFSFWLGDMHPHVMSLPFTLLAVMLALTALVRPELPSYAAGRRGWAELLVSGIILGGLYVINSWDFPSYLMLFIAALLLRFAREHAPGRLGVAWRAFGVQALLVGVAAFVLYLPFFLTFRSLVGGREPLLDIPIIATLSRTIGIVTWPKTPLHTFLIIFGLFLLPSMVWMSRLALRGRGFMAPWVFVLIGLALGTLMGLPLLVLAPLAAYAALAAYERTRDGALGDAFALLIFALGCAICFGTELIFIRDTFGNRFNTIFKFYYQVWLIWGTLAGYSMWRLLSGGVWVKDESDRPLGAAPIALRAITLLVFAALLGGGLVYPALTLSKLFGEGKQIGLNGTNPRERDADGAAAIAWLRQNAPGDAVVLEAVGSDQERIYGYDTASLGISGVSSSTGLATVIGWTNQQGQWRAGDPDVYAQIEPRRQDVQTIYTTTDVAQARDLLARYKVRYIYVGQTEHASYPPEALAKFDQMASVAFQQGAVTIYEVTQ